MLGRWKRIFFVELDGAREREALDFRVRGGVAVKVKMILPALTEATSPFFRPIKYSLFPRSVSPLWPRIWETPATSRFRTSTWKHST